MQKYQNVSDIFKIQKGMKILGLSPYSPGADVFVFTWEKNV